MRLLMISTDRNIFDLSSSVSKRMVEYGSLFDELHIIVFSKTSRNLVEGQIGQKVFLYPTSSSGRLSYIFDAVRIGKQILSQVYFGQTAITTQDPFETGVVGVRLRRTGKYPLQVQLHTDAWSPNFQYAGFLNWFRTTLLAPWVLRRADGIRVVSEKIRRDVIIHARLPAKKIFVLPIFVDVLPFSQALVTVDLHKKYPEWEIIVLVASRLEREKNVMLALKAFGKAVATHPNVGLVVVGEGAELAKLKRYANNKFPNNVAFEGWQNELISYYKTADIFLNTSFYEGYGMTIVEAGASGCPVLTTKVGVGYDLLEDGINALVCPVGDSECIYRKLVTLLENDHLRKSLGAELKNDVFANAISKEEYLKKFRSHFDSFFNAPSN